MRETRRAVLGGDHFPAWASPGTHLLETCRRTGMRLVGPNCFGVAGAGPGPGRHLRRPPSPARRRGPGGAVRRGGHRPAGALPRLGIGISSFARWAYKMDVSGNDLLMWWEQDGTTRLAVCTWNRPAARQFAGTTRRVSAHIPVLTVHAGRSAPGERAAASHTGGGGRPADHAGGPFEQADYRHLQPGRSDTAVRRTASRPGGGSPSWPTPAVPGVAADACVEAASVAGDRRADPGAAAAAVAYGAAVRGPVDTTAGVGAQQFRDCLLMVAARRPAGTRNRPTNERADRPDRGHAGAGAAGARGCPCRWRPELDQSEPSGRCPPPMASRRPGQRLPGGSSGALGRAARYSAWRPARPARCRCSRIPGRGRPRWSSLLGACPAGWLSAAEADGLLHCYGVPVVDGRIGTGAGEAVEAAQRVGRHVALKADVPRVRAQERRGRGRAGPARSGRGARRHRRLQGRNRRPCPGSVQTMIPGGTETIMGGAGTGARAAGGFGSAAGGRPGAPFRAARPGRDRGHARGG